MFRDHTRQRARPADIYQFRRDAPDHLRFPLLPTWVVRPMGAVETQWLVSLAREPRPLNHR